MDMFHLLKDYLTEEETIEEYKDYDNEDIAYEIKTLNYDIKSLLDCGAGYICGESFPSCMNDVYKVEDEIFECKRRIKYLEAYKLQKELKNKQITDKKVSKI